MLTVEVPRWRFSLNWCVLCATLAVYCGTRANAAAPPELGSGIVYTNYVFPQVPWSVHVVKMNRSDHDLEFHSTHARDSAIGLGTLSEQIRSFKPELGTPVAGVNGDFYVRDKAYAGDPRGLQILEGEVISAPVGGVSFWIDAGGKPHATNVNSLFKVTWPNGASTPIGLNEARTSKMVILYTPALGRSTHTTNGLELVLEQAGEGPWLPLRIGTTYTTRVREVNQRANTALSSNVMVLSIQPSMMDNLPTVEAGALLKISTGTAPDLQGVKTAISGGPLLVHGGRRQSFGSPSGNASFGYEFRSMTERHPRTAIGWNEKDFFLLEVDGRQPRLSVGMTLNELADFLIDMGCKEAVNFDGGGSAMFWCNGRIMNSPCDKKERAVANALLVVRKPGS